MVQIIGQVAQYYGAAPGNYNWDVAEEFIDVNQDGIYTPFFDLDEMELKIPTSIG